METDIVKVIELIGQSTSSWDDAVRNAVQRANQTVENITGVEALNFTADVANGEIVEYKVDVKLAFGVNRR